MRPRLLIGTSAMSLSLAFLSCPAHAQRYNVTELGALPGDAVSEAKALNDKGEIVGNSYTTYDDYAGGKSPHPFVWRGGQMVALPLAGPNPAAHPSGQARGINATGRVAGSILQTYATGSTTWTGYKAAVWDGDSLTVLEPGETAQDYATAINDAGHVTEVSDSIALPSGAVIVHGWLVRDGQRIPLTDDLHGMYPYALNNLDQVAGTYYPGTVFLAHSGGSTYTISEHYPALWDTGAVTNLSPDLCCGVYGWAYAINQAGVAAGSIAAEGFAGIPTATQWGGRDIIGGSASGYGSDAVGINDVGQIVGRGGDTVLWQNGRRRALKDLVADPSLAPSEVKDINNAGQIAGLRYGPTAATAVLLSPIIAGDADGNGLIDAGDALLVLRAAAGLRNPTLYEVWRGDVAPSPSADPTGSGDRKLDLADAIRIARRVAGLEPAVL